MRYLLNLKHQIKFNDADEEAVKDRKALPKELDTTSTATLINLMKQEHGKK